MSALLNGARGTVLALGHVEDDGVGVELRRGVAVHRPGGVMLELRRDELPGLLGGVVAADPRVSVLLQLFKCRRDGGSVSLFDPLVSSDQGGQGDRLRRGKGRIPPGPMLDRLGGGAVRVGVLLPFPMLHHLLFGLRMHALRESGELQRSDLARESKGGGKLALPLPFNGLVLLVVALRVAGVFQPVVRLRLAGTDGFRDREHGGLEVL